MESSPSSSLPVRLRRGRRDVVRVSLLNLRSFLFPNSSFGSLFLVLNGLNERLHKTQPVDGAKGSGPGRRHDNRRLQRVDMGKGL